MRLLAPQLAAWSVKRTAQNAHVLCFLTPHMRQVTCHYRSTRQCADDQALGGISAPPCTCTCRSSTSSCGYHDAVRQPAALPGASSRCARAASASCTAPPRTRSQVRTTPQYAATSRRAQYCSAHPSCTGAVHGAGLPPPHSCCQAMCRGCHRSSIAPPSSWSELDKLRPL